MNTVQPDGQEGKKPVDEAQKKKKKTGLLGHHSHPFWILKSVNQSVSLTTLRKGK